MIKKLLFYILMGLVLFSCKDKKTNEIEPKLVFYENSENEYKLIFPKEGYDSIIYKYRSGPIYKIGKKKVSGQKYGNWHLYTERGDLAEIREWVIVNDTNYLNRVWHMRKGDTLAQRDDPVTNQEEFVSDTLDFRNTTYNLFKYLSSDTITLEEPFSAYVHYGSPQLLEYNSEIKVFLETESLKFNGEFKDSKDLKYEIFPSVKDDSINQRFFSDYKQQYMAVFGRWYNKPGSKIIKGFVLEYAKGPFEREPLIEKAVDCLVVKTYFEKRIFVKDTI